MGSSHLKIQRIINTNKYYVNCRWILAGGGIGLYEFKQKALAAVVAGGQNERKDILYALYENNTIGYSRSDRRISLFL